MTIRYGCLIAFTGILTSCAGLAYAASPSTHRVEIGMGAGYSYADTQCSAPSLKCDRDGGSRMVFGTLHLNEHWSVEAAVLFADDFAASRNAIVPYGGDVDLRSRSLAAVYRFDWQILTIGLRAGLSETDTHVEYTAGVTGSRSRDTWQPLLGASLDLPLSDQLALRLDARTTRARLGSHHGFVVSTTAGLVVRF
jgi:hypothetical protein